MSRFSCGVSNGKAALLANAILCDLGIIDEKNPKLVIDPNKVDRARRKNREECVKNHKVIYNFYYQSCAKTVLLCNPDPKSKISLF
jgi:hypothetical protein